MDAQIQAARQARKGIEQVRKQLVNPSLESLDATQVLMAEAIDCMKGLQGQLAAPQRETHGAGILRSELLHLKRELTAAAALLSSAGAFHEGLGRLLRPDLDSDIQYSPVGAFSSRPSARRFVVHG